MSGSGESAKNMEGLVRAVKIYDAGVEGGHLTASQGCDWANTLVNCEDAVATTTFWGQIATYLSSMEYREGTAIGYFNKLFNLAREHFSPPVIVQVGTGKERNFFFLFGETEGRFYNEPVVVSIPAQRKEDLFREYIAGKLS